jgi:hypothetical protein
MRIPTVKIKIGVRVGSDIKNFVLSNEVMEQVSELKYLGTSS